MTDPIVQLTGPTANRERELAPVSALLAPILRARKAPSVFAWATALAQAGWRLMIPRTVLGSPHQQGDLVYTGQGFPEIACIDETTLLE